MAFIQCELMSKSIKMPTSIHVILPQDDLDCPEPVKTLYLLHGRSHNYSVWSRYTSIERYAQQYRVAVIMPEVNRSFYSDMKYGLNYLEYISTELPALCESMFHIGTDQSCRYIAGMSMGGYGALKAALSKPNYYAGCGAFSAVTDILTHVAETPETESKKNEFRAIFGTELGLAPEDDLYHLARQPIAESLPSFYMACGIQDHLHPENVDFYHHLSDCHYPVVYEEWPGVHDWAFWDRAIEKLLSHFFSSERRQ